MSNSKGLVERIEAATGNGKMRFSLCQDRGWVATNSEDAIRVLCDMWNHRLEIAAALRSHPTRGLPGDTEHQGGEHD